jgi:argininosuccinate synthase|tara:strand:+ start:282 stop:560 length:279 start_codon:yes stop_codon:yes gene_type:complete
MSNLDQVLEFIKNSNQSEISNIRRQVEIRRSEINYDIKSEFKVGDIVSINHKKMDPNKTFRISKINNKNIKVVSTSDRFDMYTVSPSLLIKK